MSDTTVAEAPQSPLRINHLVLRVRNLQETHDFWTGCLGFEHVATTYSADGSRATKFYSGRRNGKLTHHDVAFGEDPRLQSGDGKRSEVSHIAIEYATEDAWRKQLQFLESRNVPVSDRIMRPATFSAFVTDPTGYVIELVCERPRDIWERDINAATNATPVEV